MAEDTQTLLDRLAVWVASGLGIGFIGPAPGTVGSLWGLPLAWSVLKLDGPFQQLVFTLILGLISVLLCSRAVRALGGVKDPPEIVLDEITVLPIVFLGVEAPDWRILLTGWLLFRVSDIMKPPPCHQLEALPEGWGIQADDTMAAVYACAALHAVLWLDATFHLEILRMAA